MSRVGDIGTLAERLRYAADIESVGEFLAEIAATLGFRFYALGHHVRPDFGSSLQITNYPLALIQKTRGRSYWSEDPIVVACGKTAAGFLWSQLSEFLTLSGRQRTILAEAQAAGLGEGFTVPMNVPGECAGYCSFVTARGTAVVPAALPSAQYLGSVAFEVTRRIAKSRGQPHDLSDVPRLSSRQRDCLKLAARGKSDTVAGQLLGISNQTVHQHIETAKRRFGVASRTQLVILALFSNQLVFDDVIFDDTIPRD